MLQSSYCEDPGKSCTVHESNDDGDEVRAVVDGGENDAVARVISRDATGCCLKFQQTISVYDLKDDCHEGGS